MSLCRRMQRRYLQSLTLLTGHGKDPPICEARDCRDGDKMLCNRCTLKHEVQERGRGEMLYENAFDQNIAVGKPESMITTDTSDI